jgi:hypothetical protein
MQLNLMLVWVTASFLVVGTVMLLLQPFIDTQS